MTRTMLAFSRPALPGELFDDMTLQRLRTLVTLDEHLHAPVLARPGAAETAVLITGWGTPRLDAALLDGLPNLRAVVHAAGSVKSVVSPALWERGVRVSSCAAANAVPVAEYTLAMILLSAKHAFRAADDYRRAREITTAHLGSTVGAYGVTVGIVGASRIGRRVIELLRPFDVRTVLYDPTLTSTDAAGLGTTLVSLPELLAVADIVSLHAPSLPSSERMIGAAELAVMRDGSTLINTARGRLVDTDALVAELRSGRLHAVLDVTDPEPLPPDHPLFTAPGVVLTPHIAGSMGNELRRMGRQAVDEVERFITSGALAHEVQRSDLSTIA